VLVRLEALEDLLRVVQHRGRRLELDRAVGRDARAVPSALLRPADVDHVVGEVLAEAGLGEDVGVLGCRPGFLVRLYHELEGGGSEVLEPGRVLDLLGGRAGYRRFVLEGLKEGHREDYYQVEDQRFLGAEEFAQKLKRKVNEEEIFRRKKQLSVVFRSAARAVEVEPQVLEGADRGWEVSQSRALVGYVLIRRLGYKLKDVAKCLGRDVATVSSLVSRFAVRMSENEPLRKQAVQLAADCQE